MTITQFRDTITTFYALVNFCQDYDLEEYIEDIVSDDERDGQIDDDAIEYLRYDGSWSGLYSLLEDIPTGYEYYRRNGTFEYDPMDDDYDLQYYKDGIIESVDADFWDTEDSEEECEVVQEVDPDDIDVPDCNFDEMFDDVASGYKEELFVSQKKHMEQWQLNLEKQEEERRVKEEEDAALMSFYF